MQFLAHQHKEKKSYNDSWSDDAFFSHFLVWLKQLVFSHPPKNRPEVGGP